MSRRSFHPEGYAPSAAPYSAVVDSDGLVFVSGQVPLDPTGALVDGGFAPQLFQVRRNVEACLAAAGCSVSDVVKVTVYLARESDFDAFNADYVSWFGDELPARTTIRADLMRGFLVEIDLIARAP